MLSTLIKTEKLTWILGIVATTSRLDQRLQKCYGQQEDSLMEDPVLFHGCFPSYSISYNFNLLSCILLMHQSTRMFKMLYFY